jgi:cellulose synthase/poly-beta-1,6-N-acetylglucosamine synthase-like glycosyltransferase
VSPIVLLVLAWAGLVLAAIPALLTLANLRLFRSPPEPLAGDPPPKVSVLVPARNEERAIGRLVADVLVSEGVDLELVVLDDSSDDRTAEIVAEAAARDPRVRLVPGGPAAGRLVRQAARLLAARPGGAARHRGVSRRGRGAGA